MMGYIIMVCALILWIVSGVIYGWREIWAFGILLGVIAVVIAIRDYKLKRK